MKTKKQTKETAIEAAIPSIDTAQLDDVSGGCAACGMANCTLPNSATVPAFFQPTFRR